ncbi:MAG: methionyl-tRNA formyltransferase [Bacteroidota bacterium]
MTKKDLRIVFMGTPEFAVPALEALINKGYNVVGVITAPDKEAGRGKKVRMSAVKEFAINNKLNVLQPHKLKDADFISKLRSLNATLQIVVAFRMLPKIVWSMPKLGTFNLHASLLPQYRGAAPINFAIINGEKTTGITTFFLDKEIDTGRIIKQVEIEISNNDDVGSLHDKMMEQGATLILSTVEAILEGNIVPQEQSEFISKSRVLNIAPKLNKEDCRINWDTDSTSINNFIRGLSPYPTAFSRLLSDDGLERIVKIFKVEVESTTGHGRTPGKIISDGSKYLNVVTKTGTVSILELQLSGKKRMKVGDFLRGFQKINDYRFE